MARRADAPAGIWPPSYAATKRRSDPCVIQQGQRRFACSSIDDVTPLLLQRLGQRRAKIVVIVDDEYGRI
jgi:hypothetical protein